MEGEFILLPLLVKMKSHKKAQVWGIDAMVAASIFLIGLVAFYVFSLNYSSNAQENIELLFYDADLIASSLLSEGHPADWNTLYPDTDSIVIPGILVDYKVDDSTGGKMEILYDFANNNYELSKRKLNTKYNFYFFFTVGGIIQKIHTADGDKNGIGDPSISDDKDNIISDDIIRVERITAYKDKPVLLNLYVWR